MAWFALRGLTDRQTGKIKLTANHKRGLIQDQEFSVGVSNVYKTSQFSIHLYHHILFLLGQIEEVDYITRPQTRPCLVY